MGLQSSSEETIHSTLDIALGGKRRQRWHHAGSDAGSGLGRVYFENRQGGGERDVMIERGLERVRLFSWKSTVDRHLSWSGLIWIGSLQ
jgi:hypothetical protein